MAKNLYSLLAVLLSTALFLSAGLVPAARVQAADQQDPAGVNYLKVEPGGQNSPPGGQVPVGTTITVSWQSDGMNTAAETYCGTQSGSWSHKYSSALSGNFQIVVNQPGQFKCWVNSIRNGSVIGVSTRYFQAGEPTPTATSTPTPTPWPSATATPFISYFRVMDGNREVGWGSPQTAGSVTVGSQVQITWQTSSSQVVLYCDNGGPSSLVASGTVYHTWYSSGILVHCTLQWQSDKYEHRYFRIVAQPTATPTRIPPTSTPVPTLTPTVTSTPTPCPTLPPQPTATSVPDNPTISYGQQSCRHSVWMPATIASDGQQSCRRSEPVSSAAADAIMALPSCMSIPTEILNVCTNVQTVWTFSRGGQQRTTRLACGGAQAAEVAIDGTTLTWVVPIAVPALKTAGVTAFLTANAPIIAGVVVVGGMAYFIFQNMPTEAQNFEAYTTTSMSVLDQWLLMQYEGYSIWPRAATRVTTTETTAVAWYGQNGEWNDSMPVSLITAEN